MWSIWFFIYDLKSHLRSVKPHPQMSSDSAVPESDISIIWAVTFKHALRYVPSIRWVPDRQVLLSANHLRWCQTGRASDRLPAPGSGVPACRAGPGGAEGRPGPPAAARAGPQEGDRLHGAQDTLPVTYEVKMNNLVHKLSELLHKKFKLKFKIFSRRYFQREKNQTNTKNKHKSRVCYSETAHILVIQFQQLSRFSRLSILFYTLLLLFHVLWKIFFKKGCASLYSHELP